MATEGGLEQQIRALLKKHPGQSRTEMAQQLGISRKTLYKHLARIEKAPDAPPAKPISAPAKSKAEKQRKIGPGNPPPGPNKGSFKPGDERAGAPPGNENAVKTGEHRDPWSHYIPPEDVALMEKHGGADTAELQRQSIRNYDLRLLDMHKRLLRVQEMRKNMLTLGGSYERQEGDGDREGTYRKYTAKRQRLDDRIIEIHEAITRVQKQRDAAVSKLAAMEKGENPEGGNQAHIHVYLPLSPAAARELAMQQGLIPVDERRVGGSTP